MNKIVLTQNLRDRPVPFNCCVDALPHLLNSQLCCAATIGSCRLLLFPACCCWSPPANAAASCVDCEANCGGSTVVHALSTAPSAWQTRQSPAETRHSWHTRWRHTWW